MQWKDKAGGDLITAAGTGSLGHMMFSYRLNPRGGSSSSFVTTSGIKEIVFGLQDADGAVKHRLLSVFGSYLNHPNNPLPFAFTPCTAEKCARDDEEEAKEVFTEGSGGRMAGMQSNGPRRQEDRFGPSGSQYDFQLSFANAQVQELLRWREEQFQLQLRAKDAETEAKRLKLEQRAKDAEADGRVKEEHLKRVQDPKDLELKVKSAEAEAKLMEEQLKQAQERKCLELKAKEAESICRIKDEQLKQAQEKNDLELKAAQEKMDLELKAKEAESRCRMIDEQLKGKDKDIEILKLQLELKRLRAAPLHATLARNFTGTRCASRAATNHSRA